MDLHNDPTVIKIPLKCKPEDNGQTHDDYLQQFAVDDLHIIATEIQMITNEEYVLLVKFAPQDRFHYMMKYK